MKKKTRKGVFETNSSSTHSISIAVGGNDELLDTIIPNEDGIIILSGGEFGWEVEEYTDALTKANYCVVDQEGNDERIEMLKRVIMKQTGASVVVIEPTDDDYYPLGYVDHQSSGTSSEAFESDETLRGFIFNKNSILYTDNDNH